jgi:pimeloyl-ACP methyl ester carboxylesterase
MSNQSAPADSEITMLRQAATIAGLAPAEVTLPQNCEVLVGHHRFHYLDWGGTGQPILLLHGGGLNAHTWDVVALMLRDRYRCIALDQRGHGDSEWSPTMDYGVDRQSQDVAGFIDQLELVKPVIVGQSMGGLNALAYAVKHHKQIKGLVVVDVGPEIDAAGAQRIRDFSSTPELDSIDAFLALAVKFNPLRDPAVLRRSLYYNLRQTITGKWTLKHDQRRTAAEAAEVAAAQRSRLAEAIPAIGCPVLIVRGGLSDVLSDQAAERFAKSLPNARWVRVERAGHNVQGDNPAHLLEAMRDFFSTIGC